MKRKITMITGASRGIGAAIAEEFAKAGYDLILTCHRSGEQLEQIAMRLEKEYHISCKARICDMGNEKQVEELFGKEFGEKSYEPEELSVLVNNAGISYIGLLSDMTAEQWKRVMSTNLDSVFYTCRAAIPLMLRAKSGKIVNISSVWGNVGASMEVAYSASKGGMNAFTKALAKELAPSNIQVNAIACGVIDTEMNQCFSEEERQCLIEEIPADRMGRPEEVGKLALQLAQGNDYLTGQIITLDGGWC